MEIKEFSITKNGIYSILGNSLSIKSDLLNIINSNKYKVGYLKDNIYDMFNELTIKEQLINILKDNSYSMSSINKRVNECLKLVNLDNTYLNYNIKDLNYTIIKKIALVMSLIHNPRIIILDSYTETLMYKDKKELIRLLKLLKNKYKKTIILITKDTSFVYECSDYIYLVDTNIVKEGNKDILNDVSLLKKIDLSIPPIIEFIYECNKKHHKINYNNNILDLIKELYREIK